MAANAQRAPPAGTHIVFGRPEADTSRDSSDFSSSLLRGVVIKDQSGSSLFQQMVGRSTTNFSQITSGSQRPPKAMGDPGLEVNSEGEEDGEADRKAATAAAARQPVAGSCYNYALHDAGECRACIYFQKQSGCSRGDNCTFCHLSHLEKRARPSKAKRDRCKAAIETAKEDVTHAGPDQSQAAGRDSIRGSYMRSILAGREKKQGEGTGSASAG